jgi:3-hydroxyisobutyrate dehydrogenase-like beta-hydroxyacid dehydrogenase
VEILVIMVANEVQAENVLYGNAGAVSVMAAGTSIILSSTVSPGFVIKLKERLEGRNLPASISPKISLKTFSSFFADRFE